MILENKGAETDIPYDGKGYSIPRGKFEVSDVLGRHILQTMAKWGSQDIVVIDGEVKPAVDQVEAPAEVPAPEEEAEMAAQESEDQEEEETVVDGDEPIEEEEEADAVPEEEVTPEYEPEYPSDDEAVEEEV